MISLGSYGQENSLLLLNGKKIDGTVTENNGEFLKFEYKKKKNAFVREIDILRVYSFTQSGKETIVYYQDTILGNVFSKDEMRMFIYGEADSDKTSKGWPFFVSGLAVGYGVSLYDTYGGDDETTPVNESKFFGAGPSMMHFAVPFVFPIVCGKMKSRIKASQTSETQFLANEQYVIGYQKNARFKRIINGLIGSFIGSAMGMTTYYLAR